MFFQSFYVIKLFGLLAVFSPFVLSGAPCERIGTREWQWVGIWYPHTCHMDQRTAITTHEFYITSNSDANVQGLFFKFNKKIEFLPENTARKFPNLIVYDAEHCSIRQISKENFIGLTKLRGLTLFSNSITSVPADAFDDLSSLQELYLSMRRNIL